MRFGPQEAQVRSNAKEITRLNELAVGVRRAVVECVPPRSLFTANPITIPIKVPTVARITSANRRSPGSPSL